MTHKVKTSIKNQSDAVLDSQPVTKRFRIDAQRIESYELTVEAIDEKAAYTKARDRRCEVSDLLGIKLKLGSCKELEK